MAYYYDYHDDDDGYMWPHEHMSHDVAPYQDSVSCYDYESYDIDTYDAYNVYKSHEGKFIDYDHDLDYSDPFASSEINYFAYNCVEPKLIMYACDKGYVSYHVQHAVSYAIADTGFNEPEFEEYDPTPYGGGYDIVSVYGKPLPPSDKTCYPRSTSKPIKPKPRPEPVPEPKLEPKLEPKPQPRHEREPEPMFRPELDPKPIPEPVFVPTPIPVVGPVEPEPEPLHASVPVIELEPSGFGERVEKENEEYSYPGYGYDYPWPEYDQGYDNRMGYDYGYGKQVVQVPPCEYDPDVVDLCENIFGNWPCLARIRKQQMRIDNNPGIAHNPENRHYNPWEGCANYIFGGPIVSYNQ